MITVIEAFYLFIAMAAMGAGAWFGLALLLEYKYKRTIVIPFMIAVWLAMLLTSMAAYYHLSEEGFNLWRHCSIFFPTAICYILTKDSFSKYIFTVLTQCNVTIFIVVIINYIVKIVPHAGIAVSVSAAVLNSLLLFFYAKRGRHMYREFLSVFDEKRHVSVLIALGYALTFTTLVIATEKFNSTQLAQANLMALFILATMLLSYRAIYLIARQTRDLYRSQENASLLQAQLKHQYDEMVMFEEARKQIAVLRHDLRHHASVLMEFLRDNKMDKLESYLLSLQAANESTETQYYCANYTLNAILSIYAARAESEGIAVDIKAQVPFDLQIDDMELASINANLFENAIDGSKKDAAATNRFINIETSYDKEYRRLKLRISNNCDSTTVTFDEDGLPVSPREHGGVGIKSIKYTVEKHSGIWYFAEKAGVFTASIAISNI